MNARDAWELASFVVTVVALLLRGEDPQFQKYILRVAEEAHGTVIQLN